MSQKQSPASPANDSESKNGPHLENIEIPGQRCDSNIASPLTCEDGSKTKNCLAGQ